MRSRTIAAAVIGLAVLGGTADAQASTLSVDAACYLSGSPLNASGTGFTPAGPVNFAFDVTPAELVTAIVTEAGVLRPPYETSIAEAFRA